MISPKVSAIVNIIIAVGGALAGAGAAWSSLFGQGTAQQIVSIAGIVVAVLGSLNAALHGVSAPVAGPLVK